MKVALLGPAGTYTHQAAEEYFDELEPVFFSTIRKVFESDIEVKLVPVENSLGGGVTDTIDLLRSSQQEVTGEKVLPIEHCLISREDSIGDVEKVKSHPQALSQCQDFIAGHDWEQEETSSTASATEELSAGEAAIASKAAVNGLNLLAEGIQDNDSNVTRFLVLNGERGKGDKTSMILEPGEDRPGLLSNMLSCFSGHGINLTHIQSRPKKTKLGEYYFYVEAQAGRHQERFQDALQCLETYTRVEVLGSYTGDKT
ncbi:MAG: prephenate dehydratase [Candidatus Nanohaloarchaea archaeon]